MIKSNDNTTRDKPVTCIIEEAYYSDKEPGDRVA